MDIALLRNQALRPDRLRFFLALLLAANLAGAAYVIHLTSQQTELKYEYAHVNNLRYGFFSMETWKIHFERIVSKSITNLKLSAKDESILKNEIEKIVRVMITQADSILTKNQKTLGSKMRKAAYKALVDVPELTKRSPQFAEAVLAEITKPESLEQIRLLALNQLNRYETRNTDDDGRSLSRILAQYDVPNIHEFNGVVTPQIQSLQQHIQTVVFLMIASVLLMGALAWSLRTNVPLLKTLFGASVGLAVIILLTSLSIPMLDIDARIKSINLLLLGEPIEFTNQVLFYKSKSILQVVQILITSAKADTFVVGILLLMFSVIFPVAKLVSTILCLTEKEQYCENKGVQFFAYKSGKWSMADVLVVAIFMAYIGFNSILNDQLQQLNISGETWEMITTNETALQPGFSLFVTFVLFGLVLSEILKRIVKKELPTSDVYPSPRYKPPRLTVLS